MEKSLLFFLPILVLAVNKAISDSDTRQVLIEILEYENVNTECKKKIVRALTEKLAPVDKWISDMTDNGSNIYTPNIIDQTIARDLQYQNSWCFSCSKYGHLQINL